jgi:hypothetical protein
MVYLQREIWVSGLLLAFLIALAVLISSSPRDYGETFPSPDIAADVRLDQAV